MSDQPRTLPETQHRAGCVTIAGAPNVGKSTLLNRILGTKIAIVTPKPQTTRRRLLGIKTLPGAQILFYDTPGLHHARSLMNRRMVQQARSAIDEADVLLWVLDATAPVREEGLAPLREDRRPVVVAVNKIDRIRKVELLPVLDAIGRILPGAAIVPVSALNGENVETLLEQIVRKLPAGPAFYDPEQLTDEPERAIVAELVREQVMLETREEVPYGVAVAVDTFEEKSPRLAVISATIHVARDTYKPIVIGRRGERLKKIGQAARLEIESLLGKKVFLELFVKVSLDWNKRESRLREFGL